MSDALQSSSGRSIRQTEAGREYQAQLKTKSYKRQLQELKKLSLQVVQQRGADVVILPDISEEQAKKWIHLYISFAQTECDLHQLLLPAELQRHSEAHERVMEEIDTTRRTIEVYLKSIQPKKSTSSASVASSVRSVQSGLQLLHIEDERRKAEAAAKLAMLKTKRELERQRQELQWKEEDLALQTELEIHRRQTEVVNKFQMELDGKVEGGSGEDTAVNPPSATPADEAKHSLVTEANQQSARQVSSEIPDVQERNLPLHQPARDDIAETPASSSAQLLSGLAHLLSEQSKRSSLPALEPEVFYGDAGNFHLWMKSFESYIEARTSSSTERLHFMSRYTSGEARNAIQGFLHLSSDDAYAEAKTKLQDRYGSNFITAQNYRKRIRTWPKIAPSDGKGLQRFADYLESCEVASRTVTGLEALSDPDENVRMLQLLPRHIVNRWERVVDASLYEPRPGSSGAYPPLSEFVRFLKKEARVASGPISIRFTEETPQSPTRKTQPKTKARTFLAVADTTSASSKDSRARCKVCSADHTLENCQKFHQMNVRERHGAVYCSDVA